MAASIWEAIASERRAASVSSIRVESRNRGTIASSVHKTDVQSRGQKLQQERAKSGIHGELRRATTRMN